MADRGGRGQQENFEFLAAQDPLMAPLQETIKKQLIQREQKLDLELKEIVAKRRKIEKDKEETGVRLYGAQQQLAENQMAYEKAHDNYNIIQKLRIESEQKLAQINESYNSKKQQVVTLKGKVTKAQKELENLMKHYHDIEAYNLQLKSDIAVTRTETFTAQENVANLEKIKKKQDVLIDSMNEEIKRLEQQKNILAAQLVSQKEETEEAKKVLRDAQLEMGRIVASKKNLLERWQRSLSDMQRMDEALQSLKDSFREQEEANILLKTELNGLRSEIRKQQAKTEKTTMLVARLSTQNQAQDQKREKLQQAKQKILHQSLLLENSLKNTEEEIKKVDSERKLVDDSMNLIETNIMKLHTETKKLLEELINQKGEHTTIQKTAAGLLKQAYRLGLEIEQKEVEKQNILNEIARVRIDQLNTKTQIEQLEQKKKEVEKERYNKEILVATYEIQIRQGHDLNEKKQHEVGRLNKLHDELVSSANEETKSPLENKLANLVRETGEMDKICNEFERDWIKKQTALVHQNNKLQELEQAVSGLENKKTILEQKKARLNANYRNYEKEISSIQIGLKGLQYDMNKLNDGLAVNNEKRGKLLNENVNIESEFGQKLKDLERESVTLEVQIDALREEKADLLNQIIECERQILLWERNYQLEREMQDALDPNVGQSQIEDLKKEIHRMELKYNSIKKAQDEIQVQMIRAAKKKESIQVKYTKKPSVEKPIRQPENSNQLKKVVQNLKQTYNKIVKNIQDVDRNINGKQQELQKVNALIEDGNRQYNDLEKQTYDLQNKVVMAKTQKLLSVLKVTTLQGKYKKNEQVVNGQAKLMFQEPVLRAKVAELTEKNTGIYQAVEEVATKLPQYREVLDLVLEVSQIS